MPRSVDGGALSTKQVYNGLWEPNLPSELHFVSTCCACSGVTILKSEREAQPPQLSDFWGFGWVCQRRLAWATTRGFVMWILRMRIISLMPPRCHRRVKTFCQNCCVMGSIPVTWSWKVPRSVTDLQSYSVCQAVKVLNRRKGDKVNYLVAAVMMRDV